MRIPAKKVYRAFPELDAFSDQQCRSFVSRAQRRYRWEMILTYVLGGASSLIGLVAGVFAAGVALEVLSTTLTMGDQEELVLIGITTATAIGLGLTVPPLLVRDAGLRRLLRRVIKRAECPGCGYNLLGLPILEGAITCPECGERHTLAQIGLSREELESLIAESSGADDLGGAVGLPEDGA